MVSDEDGMLSDDGTVVYNDEESDVSIGVQALSEDIKGETIESVRALICIESADAPHDYSFDISVEDGERLVTAAEYLGEEFDTGEVYVVNDENEIVSVIDPAWAKDANEQPVNTYYTVDGNTLTQHVDFDEDTAFPVVADPTAWQVAKCAGAIAVIIAGAYCGAAKLVKVKKYVKELGGIKNSAKLIYGATSKKEKARALIKALGHLGASILGIDTALEKCSF